MGNFAEERFINIFRSDRYKKIISDLPKNSTISISGGLEPLTNFKLGEIISHAKSLGHRVPLITNAHMLTPAYLKKQPGIWDLDSLRVSLYGTDEESTYFVTRHKKAYKLVKNNILKTITPNENILFFYKLILFNSIYF